MIVPNVLPALRSLWKYRAASAVTAATLATAVAVLLAAIAVAHNFFVSPWPYDTDRLGVLSHRATGDARSAYAFRADEYRALRDSGLFERISATRSRPVALAGSDGYPLRTLLVHTQPEALDVVGTRPELGRFLDAQDAPGTTSAVISHSLWQSQFAGAPDVLGRTLHVEDAPYTIVGVMPDRFHFMGGDIWVAHTRDPGVDDGDARSYVVNVRFRPGGPAAVRGSLDAVSQRLVSAAPAARYLSGWSIDGERVIDAIMGPMRPAVALLVAISMLMLLVVLANVATLINVRQVAMEPQLAVRLALGADRRRLYAEAFASNLLLALVGVGLGWALGGLVFERIVGMISFDWIPRELEGKFEYASASAGWAPLVAVGCAALMTLSQWPRLRRISAAAALRGHSRSSAGPAVLRTVRGLAAIQVAAAALVCALALCVDAGSAGIRSRALGLDVDGVVSTRLTLPQPAYPDVAARERFAQRLRDAWRALPGVDDVAFVDAAPFQRYRRQASMSADAAGGPVDIGVSLGSGLGPVPGVLGLRLLHGRFVDDATDLATAAPVAVVSRTLALQVWKTDEAVGRTLRLAGDDSRTRTVVGVLDDVRYDGALTDPARLVYVPHAQDPAASNGLVALVRGRGGDAPDFAILARTAVALDPHVPLFETASLRDRAREALAGLTLAETMFRLFALLAVALALMATMVVLQFLLASRQREYAVRSAIGASPARLFARMLGEGARIGAIGASAGLGLAWMVAHAVDASLYGAAPWRWPIGLVASFGLLAIVVLAALPVAHRVGASDPSLALRDG